MNEYDIGKAFKRIEDELIKSMIRNLDHHRAEEEKEGFRWSQWQVEQLRALEEYKKANKKKFSKQFADINSSIEGLINLARTEGNLDQEEEILKAIKNGAKLRKGKGDITGEFFEVNNRKLDALIKATTADFERGEVAILRMANDQYRKIIFDAQVYANAGGTNYEKAVDMATKDFLSKGINCIEYKNGSRHTMAEYADMAIRTACKRAYLTGEGEKRKEWGISTVIMNKRGNPCPLCLPFVGKILIDDVWSDGPKDGKSPETGITYPLMSKAIEAGLYHPRCKDSHTTYFEGISTAPDDKYSKAELRNVAENYQREQKKQHAERQSEKFKRLSKYSLDPDNQKNYKQIKEKWKEHEKYVEKSSDTAIIKPIHTEEKDVMTEIQSLGKINTKVLEGEFGKIQTDEIIVTNERIEHIKLRHPEDYELFEKYGKESVSNPDFVVKDCKNKGTVFMLKKLPDTNLNVVVRVVLETDNSKLKNSVMTFYRIRERNLKKLIEKNQLLYKKE